MATCTKNVRIKISVAQFQKSWFLVDFEVTRFISELENAIKKRYQLKSNVQLIVDDCLLLSSDSTQVLRDGDIVSVVEVGKKRRLASPDGSQKVAACKVRDEERIEHVSPALKDPNRTLLGILGDNTNLEKGTLDSSNSTVQSEKVTPCVRSQKRKRRRKRKRKTSVTKPNVTSNNGSILSSKPADVNNSQDANHVANAHRTGKKSSSSESSSSDSSSSEDEALGGTKVAKISSNKLVGLTETRNGSEPITNRPSASKPATAGLSSSKLSELAAKNATATPSSGNKTSTTGLAGSVQTATGVSGKQDRSSTTTSSSSLSSSDSDEDDVVKSAASNHIPAVASGSATTQTPSPHGGSSSAAPSTANTKVAISEAAAPPDYTKYPPLFAAPTRGARIAFKVLALSGSYTPEVSKYTEATVLSYDGVTHELCLKIKGPLVLGPRSGKLLIDVSGKDHSPVPDKAGGKNGSTLPSSDNQVVIQNEIRKMQWSELIEPKLISLC